MGMEEMVSKISALGLCPMRSSKGVCLVVLLVHELWANSARGR